MNPFYRYKLGDALMPAGMHEEAIMQLEMAVQIAPTDGFYHFWLADVLCEAGRIGDAIIEMQQATIFSPMDSY